MQPMAGTRSAREDAADTDAWAGFHRAPDTTHLDRDDQPRAEWLRSHAIEPASSASQELTVK
jgi:hypothetical protein